MENLVLIGLECDDPTNDLIRCRSGQLEVLGGQHLDGGLVVAEESEMVIAEVWTELFHRPYNSKEFFFPHGIVQLRINKHFGDERNRTITSFILLGQHSANSIITSIGS